MDSPAPDAELMELVAAGESEGVLQDAILVCSHQQLVPTHCTRGQTHFNLDDIHVLLTSASVSFQVAFWDPLLLVVTNVGRHLLSADLCKVSRDHAVVERVEHAEEASVHPGGGLHIEDQVEAQEGGHHRQVAKDADHIADFVYQEEPFINHSRSGALGKGASL